MFGRPGSSHSECVLSPMHSTQLIWFQVRIDRYVSGSKGGNLEWKH
jgi:hypothetical protein